MILKTCPPGTFYNIYKKECTSYDGTIDCKYRCITTSIGPTSTAASTSTTSHQTLQSSQTSTSSSVVSNSIVASTTPPYSTHEIPVHSTTQTNTDRAVDTSSSKSTHGEVTTSVGDASPSNQPTSGTSPTVANKTLGITTQTSLPTNTHGSTDTTRDMTSLTGNASNSTESALNSTYLSTPLYTQPGTQNHSIKSTEQPKIDITSESTIDIIPTTEITRQSSSIQSTSADFTDSPIEKLTSLLSRIFTKSNTVTFHSTNQNIDTSTQTSVQNVIHQTSNPPEQSTGHSSQFTTENEPTQSFTNDFSSEYSTQQMVTEMLAGSVSEVLLSSTKTPTITNNVPDITTTDIPSYSTKPILTTDSLHLTSDISTVEPFTSDSVSTTHRGSTSKKENCTSQGHQSSSPRSKTIEGVTSGSTVVYSGKTYRNSSVTNLFNTTHMMTTNVTKTDNKSEIKGEVMSQTNGICMMLV